MTITRYSVLIFLVEFYIILSSTFILPSSTHSYRVDLWWQTKFVQNLMSHFRKLNMTSAPDMTSFKYMRLIIGKIVRAVINSTEYIKLMSPTSPSTPSCETTWTSNFFSCKTYILPLTTTETLSSLMSFLCTKCIKTIKSRRSSLCICLLYLGICLTDFNDICAGTPKFCLCSFLKLVITRQWNHGIKS